MELEKYFNILDNLLPQIFPHKDFCAQNLLNLRRKTKNQNAKVYKKEFLPFNTRNTDWLVNYCLDVYRNCSASKTKADKKNRIYMPENIVRLYLSTSRKFDRKRCAYESGLVEEYLKLVVNQNVSDFFTSAMTKGEIAKSIDYDKIIRSKVESAMCYLGIDNYVVQNTLELNAASWREEAKKIAFDNAYSKAKKDLIEKNKEELLTYAPQSLDNIRESYQALYCVWSELRDNEYNKQFKDVILRNCPQKYRVLSREKEQKLTAELEELGATYEYELFNAEMTINQIDYEKQQAKKEERAKNFNQTFVTEAKQLAWEEKAKYWDEHQPEINYNPKKRIFVGRKLISAEKEKFWDEHQPESNANKQQIMEEKRLKKVALRFNQFIEKTK